VRDDLAVVAEVHVFEAPRWTRVKTLCKVT